MSKKELFQILVKNSRHETEQIPTEFSKVEQNMLQRCEENAKNGNTRISYFVYEPLDDGIPRCSLMNILASCKYDIKKQKYVGQCEKICEAMKSNGLSCDINRYQKDYIKMNVSWD